MKPSSFEFFEPRSVEEAVDVLAEYGPDAKVLAGGQSLIPLMALRLARPQAIVDINRIEALNVLGDTGETLEIGALVRHRAIERHPGLNGRCSMIVDAVAAVGHVAIRNRGTVVGSLAHADPAAEWPALALALNAEVDAIGPSGRRTIPISSFFETYFTTALAPDELAVATRLQLPAGRMGSSFVELVRREGDFAIAGAGALLVVNESGIVTDARLVLIGVGETATRAPEAEQLLIGSPPGEQVFAEASEIVYQLCDPPGDVHGSSEYRRTVVRVMTRRTLTLAAKRALKGAHA